MLQKNIKKRGSSKKKEEVQIFVFKKKSLCLFDLLRLARICSMPHHV